MGYGAPRGDERGAKGGLEGVGAGVSRSVSKARQDKIALKCDPYYLSTREYSL